MDIIKAPTRQQIQAAVEWLSTGPHLNPDLEYVLSLILMGRLPQNQGELLAIAHTAANPEILDRSHICGALMAGPDNKNVSLAGCDRTTTDALLPLVQSRGCPQRIATSFPSRDWVRPRLLRSYHLQREYTSLIMVCTQVPAEGNGRWATPDDKPALQAYLAANQAERGIRIVPDDWEALIQQKRVAVLEHQGQVVSVMKRGATLHHGMIVGAFTFAPFRRQGFGRQLLAFVLRELFQEFSAVKLWVDDDNWGAIALYKSLGFQPVGSHYTGYFTNR
ncbi:N-acetyltransferase family protein [Nodosilinea sp. AN01ver1]|uniref:GNAT family N-acetyltransferase n=1 Tax=Nodosilinea sp. AN01ver1 TaxID=3423362 RepID=UPI003D3120F5